MTPNPNAQPKKRRTRPFLIALASLVGISLGGYYALTQGFIGRWIIESVLSRRVGATASLDAIHIHKSGRTDLYGLRFRVPDVPGKAGTFFEAKRLEVDLDTRNWFRGEIGLEAVAAEGITARIAQDAETDRVNIQSWRPPSGSGGGLGRLPRVVVRSGNIEFGESRGKEFTILKSFEVRGEVKPEDADSVRINFNEIRRLPDKTEKFGMAVGGNITPLGVELVLTNVSLADWPISSVPSRFRPIFRELALSGEISRTKLQYSFRQETGPASDAAIEGVAAILEFNNLGVSLPGISEQRHGLTQIPNQAAPGADPFRLMRLEADRGTIMFVDGRTEARLGGTIEGVPYTVQAVYKGTTAQSPFEVVFALGEFDLRKDSPVLRFATPLVLERLQDFGFPTGKVRSQIVVSRAQGRDIQLRGEVRLREGVAAFHRFPYEFQNIRALVTFTQDEIVIQRVEGSADGGATIVAEGRIAPPNDEAGVLVKVRAENVPIDRKVEEAMGPKRSKLIRRIFNKEQYEALLSRGAIRRPIDPTPGAPTPPAAEASTDPDAPPEFALGGRANIDVTVTREAGAGLDPWHDTIVVDFPKAGLLAEKFPYPLVGENLRTVITDGMLHLDKAQLRGLRGGTVQITADLDATSRPDHVPDPDPTIRIDASDFEIDSLLIGALPTHEVDGKSARSVVSALGLTGSIDANVLLAPNAKQELGVRVEITPRTLDALPRLRVPAIPREDAPLAGEVVLRSLTGRIVLDDDLLALDLAGFASRESEATTATPAATPFTLKARADLSGKGRSTAEFHARKLDLSLPLEGVLAIVAPSAAADLSDLRDAFEPHGVLDLGVIAAVTPDRTDADITIQSIESARLVLPAIPGAADSAEVALVRSTGSLRIHPGDAGRPTQFEFFDFHADVLSNGVPDGSVHASGAAALLHGALSHPPDKASSLDLSWSDAQVGSPLCRWIGATILGELAGDLHHRHNPQGPFDLTLRVLPGGDRPDIRGEIRPRSLQLTMSDGVVEFPHIEGVARFDRRSVSFEKAILGAERWSVALSGMWKREDSGRSEGVANLAIDSLGIPADLMAAAPAGISDALRDLNVNATGSVHIPSLEVRAWWDAAPGEDSNGRPDRMRASGSLVVEGGSADVGVDVTEAGGTIEFEAFREGRDALLRYDLNGSFPQLRLAGVQLENGRVRVVSGERSGETFVPLVSGDCHGGRISGQASVFPTGGTSETERDFDVRMAFSGVTLGPLVEDLRRKLSADAGKGEARAGGNGSAADSASRSTARLDAGVSLTGTLGRPETRRGRGVASAGQGTLVSLPLVIRLVEASNLMLPFGEPLDLMQASFFVQERTVNFEELSFFSPSVEFLGFGTLAWPNMDLNMYFTHRATYRIPIVGHVIEGLRNELLTTTVGGTLAEPSFGVSSMRGTRNLLGNLFGDSDDPQVRRMRELEERGRRGIDRVRVSPGNAR